MRHVICALSLLAGLCSMCYGKNNLTLLVQFQDRHSILSIEAMKAELKSIMKGVEVDWKLIADVPDGQSFPDLVVVKFKGVCEMAPIPPYLIDERGPLAFTHTSDGQVLPFSEVECDKVRQSISGVVRGNDSKRANVLLGRALGRVLAHELHHVLENTRHHEKEGVNQRALTAAQLISEHL